MKVLVTGDLGYIGSVMVELLLAAKHDVVGYDIGYFSGSDFIKRNYKIKRIMKDIRDVTKEDLRGFDAVIHLAALSNDACGDIDSKLTELINRQASVRLAKLSKEAGVERFLFSSSCSMYGAAGSDLATEESPFDPQSHYAVSKVETERDISKLSDKSFAPIFLRNSTVYGVSHRMRFDLVVNDMLGYAFTIKVIKMFSDGTPWRPIIHVRDVSSAFIAALKAPFDDINNQAFNVGINSENYQIKEIAETIASIIPNTKVECLNIDKRKGSYKVDFTKIKETLEFKPKWTLRDGIVELYDVLKKKKFTYENLQEDKYITVDYLKRLLNENKLTKDLRWKR